MAELIYDPGSLSPGESVFVLHVGQARPSETILASLTMDLVAPLDDKVREPLIFSGFEQRAGDLVAMAHERARERGVARILVVDPFGLLRLAPPARRRAR